MQHAFFGWRVVAGAFVLAVFGWAIGFYGPPVYLHAVQETRHWSTVLVSSAVTLHFLVGAVVVANLPALYRRFGLPEVTKTGATLLALGVLGWAEAREPWQLLLATVSSGAGWVAMGAAAVNAIVAPWFVRKRPAALSMAYNGASIGGVMFSPLWVAAIAGSASRRRPWSSASRLCWRSGCCPTCSSRARPKALAKWPTGKPAAPSRPCQSRLGRWQESCGATCASLHWPARWRLASSPRSA
jgi:MFS family permease